MMPSAASSVPPVVFWPALAPVNQTSSEALTSASRSIVTPALSAALAIWALFYRGGVAVDPLVAGPAAPVAFSLVVAVCLSVYALVVATSLASRRRS